MTLEEAIKKVEHYWHTGMDDYFTYDEIFELEEMLKELKERRNGGSNNSNAREDFMDIVYNELSDDSDNCRANRIIDAADEYADSFGERDEDDR